MQPTLDGATRVFFIVGDPIAQVKSPAGVTQGLQARHRNAMVMPAHVVPARLAQWLTGVSQAQNVDGIIATVPHKFAAYDLCASTSARATFLRAANVMRRNADGSWHGDMCDGAGFVEAMRGHGCEPAGRSALLVGAGGAGSAIAHALVMAGVSALAIHDQDATRRATLVDRLAGLQRSSVVAGSTDPRGYDIVVNATPVGMRIDDPYPLDVGQLGAGMFVGCVITAPAVTPLIAAARAKGCRTMTGTDMFCRVRDMIVAFLLGD